MSNRMSRTRHFARATRRYSALTVDGTPLILDPSDEADAARLTELRAGGAHSREDDTLAGQLRDLMDARSPAVDLTAHERDARVRPEAPAFRPDS